MQMRVAQVEESTKSQAARATLQSLLQSMKLPTQKDAGALTKKISGRNAVFLARYEWYVQYPFNRRHSGAICYSIPIKKLSIQDTSAFCGRFFHWHFIFVQRVLFLASISCFLHGMFQLADWVGWGNAVTPMLVCTLLDATLDARHVEIVGWCQHRR